MPLQIPSIDDRRYQELLNEALARIPVHNREWTNFNKSDPGVTLLEVFAFMAESLLYRSNQIPERNRLKILGRARIKDAREHPELVSQLAEKEAQPIVERFFIIDVVAFDWNCSKYITPRYTAEEVARAVAPLKERIAELEARVKACAGQPAAIVKNDD